MPECDRCNRLVLKVTHLEELDRVFCKDCIVLALKVLSEISKFLDKENPEPPVLEEQVPVADEEEKEILRTLENDDEQ